MFKPRLGLDIQTATTVARCLKPAWDWMYTRLYSRSLRVGVNTTLVQVCRTRCFVYLFLITSRFLFTFTRTRITSRVVAMPGYIRTTYCIRTCISYIHTYTWSCISRKQLTCVLYPPSSSEVDRPSGSACTLYSYVPAYGYECTGELTLFKTSCAFVLAMMWGNYVQTNNKDPCAPGNA